MRVGLLVAIVGIVQQVVRRLLASPPPTPDPSTSTAARAPDKVTAVPRSAPVDKAEAEPVTVPTGEGPAATKAPAKKATAAKKAPAKKAAGTGKAAGKKAAAKKAAKPAEPGTGSESD